MYHLRYIILSIFYTIALFANAQNSFPDDYFRSPLDIPLYLAGTFGELRTNHFHAGIDIKTKGIEGLKVYAVAGGYVSRVKVSLGGYGNAIYITHPNGYVSVYGHLKQFNSAIKKYVKEQQYKKKSFTVDLFPDKDLLKVGKGDVIAISGNSGGSTGPHLHFEIREAANQHPVNPLLFKSIKVADNRRPVIAGLLLYPIGDSSLVAGYAGTALFKVTGNAGDYHLFNDTVVTVHGNISFGLRAYDRMNRINNKNGIYKEQLWIDSALVFDIEFKELSFYTSRYINSLIDYRYFQESKHRVVRTELDTNNRLNIYNTVKHNGIFTFNDTLVHHLKYIVRDAYGNSSNLNFKIKGYIPDSIPVKNSLVSNDSAININFSKQAKISFDGLTVVFPPNTFYRSLSLPYKRSPGGNDSFADFYTIGSRFVPVQKYFKLSISVDDKIADSLQSKLYIAKVDEGDKLSYAGGNFNGGLLTAKVRSLGTFTIGLDTLPPTIKPVNIRGKKRITSQKSIKLRISDKTTGIKKYAAFLNDRWILMEYDPKKETVTYNFDNHLVKGKNMFKLYVFDNRDNRSVYEAEIFNP